jgi:hypothetical protein
MPVVLDTYRLVTALRSTGKNANFTAEEIASAIDVSQQGSDVLTRSAFEVTMAGVDARFSRVDAAMGNFDARLEAAQTPSGAAPVPPARCIMHSYIRQRSR